MILQTEIARQKKVSRLKYTDGFIPSVIVWHTDGCIPSVNSSVIVAGTVKYRRIMSFGKFVGECIIQTEYIRL